MVEDKVLFKSALLFCTFRKGVRPWPLSRQQFVKSDFSWVGRRNIEQSNFPLISSVPLDVRSGTILERNICVTLGETVRPVIITTSVGTSAMAFCSRKERRASIPNTMRESGDLHPRSRAWVRGWELLRRKRLGYEGVLAKPIQQDSCWRQAGVIRFD